MISPNISQKNSLTHLKSNRAHKFNWLTNYTLAISKWSFAFKQIFRYRLQRKIFAYFMGSALMVFFLSEKVMAATAPWVVPGEAKTCAGFLCGPVTVINGNSPFKDTENAKNLVIMLFLVINIAIAVGLGYKMYEAFRNHQSGEDWQTVAITLVVAILGLVGFNYVVGMFFGIA
jgi:hypothetical protein